MSMYNDTNHDRIEDPGKLKEIGLYLLDVLGKEKEYLRIKEPT